MSSQYFKISIKFFIKSSEIFKILTIVKKLIKSCILPPPHFLLLGCVPCRV
nr:MAG TPA: hypothetical protein [Caudoviricetes sp.]